jgi:hypothetical protein
MNSNPILTLQQFGPMTGDSPHRSYPKVTFDVREVNYCVEGAIQMPFNPSEAARNGYPRRDEAHYNATQIFFENGQSVTVWNFCAKQIYDLKLELENRYEIAERALDPDEERLKKELLERAGISE